MKNSTAKLIYKPGSRLLSFLVTLVFCLNQVLAVPLPSAYAESVSQAPEGIMTGEPSTPFVSFASAKVKEMTVPSGLGSIEEIHDTVSEHKVIFLQDAHDIPGAQKSLEALVEYFQKEYGIKTVALEGIQGDLDQTLLRSFPDQKKLREVFDSYLDNGEISGAAAASVLSPYISRYTGLEDWELYQDGITAFLQALSDQNGLQNQIQNKVKALSAEKDKAYSAQAKVLDEALEKWNNDYSSMETLLSVLRSIAAPDAGKYPMIDQMIQLQLKSHEAYVGNAVQEHAELERKIKSIDGQELMKEINRYVAEVKGRVLVSENEQDLDRRTEALRILRRLSDFKLTIDQWRASKSSWQNYEEINGLEHFLEFYEIAEKRDQVFVEKLNVLLKESENNTVLFAGGGFHKEGICEALKKQNVAYVTVMPKIAELPEESGYLKHMRGDVSWSDYFEVKDGRIDLYDAFLRSAMDRLLNAQQITADLTLLKRWRDSLIQHLAAENRIDQAASYTHYLDRYAKAQLTPEKLADVRKQWEMRLHQVIDQLKILEEKNQLTEINVARLLYSFSTVTYLAAGSFQRGLRIPAWWTGRNQETAYLSGSSLSEAGEPFRSELRNQESSADSAGEIPQRRITVDDELTAQQKRQAALAKLKNEFPDDDYIEDFFYLLTENFPLEHLAADTVTVERLSGQVAFAYEMVRAYQKDPQKNLQKNFLSPEGIPHTEFFIAGKDYGGVRSDIVRAIEEKGAKSLQEYFRTILLPETAENPETEVTIWIFEIAMPAEEGTRTLEQIEQFRIVNQYEKIRQGNIRKGQAEAQVRGRASMPNALRRGKVAFLKPFAETIGINDVVTDIFSDLRGELTNGKLGAAIKQRRAEDWQKFSQKFDDYIAREKGLIKEASRPGPRDFLETGLSLLWWGLKKGWNFILTRLSHALKINWPLKLQLSAPVEPSKITQQEREAALAAISYIQALKEQTFRASRRPLEGVLPYYGGARSIFEEIAAQHIKAEKQLEKIKDESERREARKMKDYLTSLIRELHSDFRIWGLSSKFREGQYDEEHQRKLVEDEIQRFKTAFEKVVGFEVILETSGRSAEMEDDYDQVDKMVTDMARKIIRLMENDNRVAERAIALAVNPFVKGLQGSGIEKQITNAREMDRIFLRVLLTLREGTVTASDVRVTETEGKMILFARDLDPYQLRDILEEYPAIVGIVTDQGTLNAHWVEKARNRGIPVLILDSFDQTLESPISEVFTGKEVFLWKSAEGQPEMVVNPEAETVKRYEIEESKQNALDEMARNHLHEKAVTADGQEVIFYATADDADEVQAAFENGADGIGLVRTEYLFGRNNPFLQRYIQNPTPQKRKALIEDLKKRFEEMAILTTRGPLTLRAPDNARDKPLGVNNPEKKYGIEYYLDSEEGRDILSIFLEAAMLAQTSEDLPGKREIRILFPMDFVSEDIMRFLDREDLKNLRGVELERLQSVNRRFINLASFAFNDVRMTVAAGLRRMEKPELIARLDSLKRGFMVESQEGRALLDEIIEASDFVNYGMNDLTLSIFRELNISRDNEEDAQYGELRPEVFGAVKEDLERLKKRADAGEKIIPFCFCGTWPGMPEAVLVMAGEASDKIEVKLSIPPVLIPGARQFVRFIQKSDTQLGLEDAELQENPALLHKRAAAKVEEIRERMRQTDEYQELLKALEGPEKQTAVEGQIDSEFSADATEVTQILRVASFSGNHVTPLTLLFKAHQAYPDVVITLERLSDGMQVEIGSTKPPLFYMEEAATAQYALIKVTMKGTGAGRLMQAMQNIRENELSSEAGLIVYENPALKETFDTFMAPSDPLFGMDEFVLELGKVRVEFDMGLIGKWRKLSGNGDDQSEGYRRAKRHFSDIYFLTQTETVANLKEGDVYGLELTGVEGEWGLQIKSISAEGQKVFEVINRSELRFNSLTNEEKSERDIREFVRQQVIRLVGLADIEVIDSGDYLDAEKPQMILDVSAQYNSSSEKMEIGLTVDYRHQEVFDYFETGRLGRLIESINSELQNAVDSGEVFLSTGQLEYKITLNFILDEENFQNVEQEAFQWFSRSLTEEYGLQVVQQFDPEKPAGNQVRLDFGFEWNPDPSNRQIVVRVEFPDVESQQRFSAKIDFRKEAEEYSQFMQAHGYQGSVYIGVAVAVPSELRSNPVIGEVLAGLFSKSRSSRAELRDFSEWLSRRGTDVFGSVATVWLADERNLYESLWNTAAFAAEDAAVDASVTSQAEVRQKADAILQVIRQNRERNLWMRLSDRDVRDMEDISPDSQGYQFLETLTTLARNGRTVSLVTASTQDQRTAVQAIDRFFNTVYGTEHRDQWRLFRSRIKIIRLSEIASYRGMSAQIDFVTDLEEAQLINAGQDTAAKFERLIVSDFIRENGQLSFLGATLLEKTRLLLEAATGSAGVTGLYADSNTSRIHFADSAILNGINELLSVLNEGNRAILASA